MSVFYNPWLEELEQKSEERFENLPECSDCGNKIQDGFKYLSEEGDILCRDCFSERYHGETDEGYICPHCGRLLTFDIGCFYLEDSTYCEDYVDENYREEISDD